MDFDDTPREAAFRAEARAWLGEHAVLRTEPDRRSPLGETDRDAELARVRRAQEWQATLYEHGWAGITWPAAYGGRGLSALEQVVWNQEVARFDAPSGVFAQGIGMAGPTIIAHGTDEQKERFLGPMLRGDEIWCQLFSEPGAGSDLAALSTRAVVDGDEFVVNGQKVWTSSAHYSDWGILLARTDVDAPKHRGITYFLLDMRTSGVEVRPLRQITGGAHFNEVFLTDVRIPATNVVGAVDGGWGVTMTTLSNERAFIAGNPGDTFADLMALATRFRVTDDRVVRQALAGVYIRLSLLKYLAWRAQTAVSQGRIPGPETSVMKLGYSRHLAALGDLGMAIAGASGTLLGEDDEITRWGHQLLGQWASRIGGGTDEVQRNVIGERVLGLPGDVRLDKGVPFRDIPR